MPVDASIPLQVHQLKVPGPAEMLSLQNLITQGDINKVNLQEKQTELNQRNSLLKIMQQPGNTDPNTGMLTPIGLGQITQINPQLGMTLGHQQQQISLQNMQIDEKRTAVKKNILGSYVKTYQDALQSTNGNTQEAERIAREGTLSAINEGESSGHFASQGISSDGIAKLKQLPPPETARTMLTALGGSFEQPPKQEHVTTANTESPTGLAYYDPRTKQVLRDSSGKVVPAAPTLQASMANIQINPEDKEFWADIIRKGGSLPPGLARSAAGAKLVAEVMQQVPKAPAGKTERTQPADVIANQSELKGINAGQRTIGTKQAQIEMAVTEAKNMAPLALQASNAVDRTKYPTLNTALLAAEKGTGDENVVRLGVATNSLINIYARAINPTGVATVSDKDHARELLAAAWSKGQYAAGVDQLMKELAAAQKSPPQVRGAMREALTGKKTEGRTEAPQAALDYLKAHPEAADHFKAKYGYLP